MNQEVIDERAFVSEFKRENLEGFYDFVKAYDEYMYPIMRAAGWRPVIVGTRTVLFTFGDVEIIRRGYKKGDKWRYPVDEKLGLLPYERYSKELLYQIAKVSTLVSYRKVSEIIEMMYGIYINRETVRKAVKMASTLFNEHDDYRYYEEHEKHEKIKAPVLFIEGDGVMVKTTVGEDKRTDLAHFVIHTGSQQIEKKRWELQNKHEVISTSHAEAVDCLTDLLYNEYEITENTIIVTNSDGGHGYSPYIFKELAKLYKIKRHEHFWDEYHLNQKIKSIFKVFDPVLKDSLFSAIQKHDKKAVRVIFDTAESLCESEEQTESVLKFKRHLL